MFNVKKFVAALVVAAALISTLAVGTLAYAMGGASVGSKGHGYIWNDQNSPHTLYGETIGSADYRDKEAGIRVRIAFTDPYGYSRNAYAPSVTGYTTGAKGYASDSVSISETSTPVTGYGYYKIDGTTASSSKAWNFG